MWFIKAMVLTPPYSTASVATTWATPAPPPHAGFAGVAPTRDLPTTSSSLPNFIWPEPVWPLSEWKRYQEREKLAMEDEKLSLSFSSNASSVGISSSSSSSFSSSFSSSSSSISSSSKLSWSRCKRVNDTTHDGDLDDSDSDDQDDDDDDESWWSSRLRIPCLTDRAEQVVLSLMWINAAFFFLQSFLIIFLNIVDTRAIMIE